MGMRITKNGFISESSKFSINSQGKVVRTYTHKRLIQSPDEGFNWDLAAALHYSPGQPHSSDPRAKLWEMDLDRHKTREPCNAWDLTLTFSTECPAAYNNSEDPTQQRVKRAWSTTEHTLYAVKDRNNKLICNLAGQPFDGGVPVAIELPTLVCERNESDFDGGAMAAMANSLNSDSYSGADPETLKLKISATEHNESDFHYWAVRYEMVYFLLGWQPQPANAGLYQLVNNKLTRCKDKDQQDVTAPVPLDLSGKQIPVASLPAAANFIHVDFFPLMAYASLNL